MTLHAAMVFDSVCFAVRRTFRCMLGFKIISYIFVAYMVRSYKNDMHL